QPDARQDLQETEQVPPRAQVLREVRTEPLLPFPGNFPAQTVAHPSPVKTNTTEPPFLPLRHTHTRQPDPSSRMPWTKARSSKSDKELELKDYATRGIYWAKRSRRWTKAQYSPRALSLLKDIYELLLNRTSTTEWVNTNVTDILRAEETFINVKLHVVLVKVLIKHEDFATAWEHVHDQRDTFADSLEWNLFIKEDFEILRSGVPADIGFDEEPSEMYLGACDNVLRIALDTRPPNECDKLMREFRHIVDTHDLPASRKTKPAVRRWSRIRQEYQSRACRHQAMLSLKRGPRKFPPPSPLNPRHLAEPLEPSHHEAIRSACLSLRMCLSYHNLLESSEFSQRFEYLAPMDVMEDLGLDRRLHMLMCQRIAESSHVLLSLLRCFQFSYMRSKNDRLRFDQQYNIVGRRKYDSPTAVMRRETEEGEDGPLDVKRAFYLPTVWGIEPKDAVEGEEGGGDAGGSEVSEVPEVWPDSLLDLVQWIADNKETVDQIAVMTRMYDLEFVVEMAGWNVENDGMRKWLKALFPKLLDELESTHQRTPTPTLMDLESFILILLLQRHAICVVRGGARTMGQLLFMAGQRDSFYRMSEGQVRFWSSCLCMFGRPMTQKKAYVDNVLTGDELRQCIREIRGEFVYEEYAHDPATVERQNYLYLALGVIYQNLIELHNLDCSIEAMHYLGVYEAWKARGGGTSDNVRDRWKGLVDRKLKFLVLDHEASDEEYKMLVRYNDGQTDDQLITSLHVHSPSLAPTITTGPVDTDDNPFTIKPPPPILRTPLPDPSKRIINPTPLADYVLSVPNTRHLFASSPSFDEHGNVNETRKCTPKKGVLPSSTPRKVVLHLGNSRKRRGILAPVKFAGWEERERSDLYGWEHEEGEDEEEVATDGAKNSKFSMVVVDPDGARSNIPIGNVQQEFWAEFSIRRNLEDDDERWLDDEVAKGVLGREGDEDEIVPNEPLAMVLKREVGYDSGYASMIDWERPEARNEGRESPVRNVKEENADKDEEDMHNATPTRYGNHSPDTLFPPNSSILDEATPPVLPTWRRPSVNTSPRRRATLELPKQLPPIRDPSPQTPRAALFSLHRRSNSQSSTSGPSPSPSSMHRYDLVSPTPSSRFPLARPAPLGDYVDSEEETSETEDGDPERDADEFAEVASAAGDESRDGSVWSYGSGSTGVGSSVDGMNSPRLTRQLKKLDLAKSLSLSPPSSLTLSHSVEDGGWLG
ncbi:hypothetical protein BC936DRAFT_136888, partial [Jimgerdemannia flammicorona]